MAEESRFEKYVVQKLLDMFPGAVILKNDSSARQGIPDRLILFGKNWAMFEVKARRTSSRRPNQEYYISVLNKMSYASFVYPENEEVFFNEIQQALRPERSTRIFKR